MKSNELNNIITSVLEEEVRKAILSESKKGKKTVYHVTCEGEPLATFDSLEEAKKWCEENKHSDELKGKKKLLIDKKVYESYGHMIDSLDEMGNQLEEKESTDLNEMFRQPEMYDNYDDTMDEVKNKVDEWLEMGKIDEQEHYEMMSRIDSEDLDWPTGAGENETKHILKSLARECAPHLLKKKKETENMENQEPMEGNGYIKAMLDAKEKGEDTFDFDGETHDVKEVYSQLEEEEGMCEGSGCSGEVMEKAEICEKCGCKECECGKKSVNEKLKGKQVRLDVDKDGEIEGSDLAALRKKKIKEGFRDGVDLGASFEKFKRANLHALPNEGPDDFDTQIQPEELPSFDDDNELPGLDTEVKEGKGMCSECGTMLTEEGMCLECGSGKMYESKKSKKLRLSEIEFTEMIKKMVLESIPGLEAVKKSHNDASGEDLKNSTKKITDYLSFPGNTNPEFPQQVGEDKEKEAYRNDKEEEEYIDTYRGEGMHNLNYDNEPSKEFIERLRMALEGDSKMGNGQKDTANTVPSNVGSDMFKSIDKEQKRREAELVSYKKDPAPVQDVNESVEKNSVVLEEIKRMKEMSSYNKKTQ